jgi:hypothetical protein
VLLSVEARQLLLATWETDRESVARVLPSGLEPAEVDGRHLVSVAALRYTGGRVGRLPTPPYSQLNVRAYVSWRAEPAVFFLTARVSAFGLGGALLGAPYRIARLRFRRGSIEAPALGLSLRYAIDGPAHAGPLGEHELGLFEAGGLRAFRIRRGEAEWFRAELTALPRADLLVAYGFELAGPPELLYAERASFETDLPPRPAE